MENDSRTNSAKSSRATSGAGQKSATNIRNTFPRPASRDLLSREQEYKRLNEELEAKTASLVREAEEVMRDQDFVLSRSRLLDNINTEDFLKDFDDDLTGRNEDQESRQQNSRQEYKVTNQSRPLSTNQSRPLSTNQSRPLSTNLSRPQYTNENRPSSKVKKSGKSKLKSKKSSCADDVAIVDDITFLTDFSLQQTITAMEDQTEALAISDDEGDDILPLGAADMGSEATIRFLKAKLRVMQEELDRVAQDCSTKDEVANSLSGKIKDLDEERNRLQRSNTLQQTQLEKFKKMLEDTKGKSDSLDNQLAGLRKELEAMKRTQKQQTTTHGATEVRLNRAMEEIEKYKEQLHGAKATSKDTNEHGKKRIEQLTAENKRLEKQKTELMTGFKKQLKLIDILKRQKMHIEAAKMLAFSEEEFVKALEWGS